MAWQTVYAPFRYGDKNKMITVKIYKTKEEWNYNRDKTFKPFFSLDEAIEVAKRASQKRGFIYTPPIEENKDSINKF